MSILMPQIAARLFDTPLMVAPEKAKAILMGMGGRIVDGGVVLIAEADALNDGVFAAAQSMGRVGDRLGRAWDQAGRRPYDVHERVAVVPVEGTLVHKGAWIGQSSGETSYQGLMTQIVRIANDPEIKGAVFEVDSFGGQVSGAFECAEMMARLSAVKPTMAILTDFALSAGYLLASACRQVVVPQTGSVGSIGVITLHLDASKALEAAGMKVTLIASGERKTDGHPSQPISEEALGLAKARVDATRDLFCAAVGKYRGPRLSKAQAFATEAGIYQGREGVTAGLADAVGPANDAFAAFVKAVNKAA